MTATDAARALQSMGPTSAPDLAHRTGIRLEDLYGLLIAGEARGLVRVNVDCYNQASRTWEAMKENP